MHTARKKKSLGSLQNHWTLRLVRINVCSFYFSSWVHSFYTFLHFSSLCLDNKQLSTIPSKRIHIHRLPTHIWVSSTDGSCERCPRDDNIDKEDRDRSCSAGYGDLIHQYQQVDVPAALIQRFKSYHFVMIHVPIRVTDYISFNWKWFQFVFQHLQHGGNKKYHNKFGPSQSPVELGSCRPQSCLPRISRFWGDFWLLGKKKHQKSHVKNKWRSIQQLVQICLASHIHWKESSLGPVTTKYQKVTKHDVMM